LTKST